MAAPKNPLGAKSDKLWRNALMLAINREVPGSKEKHLNRLATQLVKKAGQGDIQALREIGDRLDGKPAQSVTVGNDEETGAFVITWAGK